MGTYSVTDPETGEFVDVYDIEDCLRSIRIRNQFLEKRIKRLREENQRLKEDHYNDAEIMQLSYDLAKVIEDNSRGFPISEKEEKVIEAWKKNHERKVHHSSSDIPRAIYCYKFIPTSVGTYGVVICSCGAEFEFRKIGE